MVVSSAIFLRTGQKMVRETKDIDRSLGWGVGLKPILGVHMDEGKSLTPACWLARATSVAS